MLYEQLIPTYGATGVEWFFAEARKRAQDMLSRARQTWPLFREFEREIRDEMVANPVLSLRDAYDRVIGSTITPNNERWWRNAQQHIDVPAAKTALKNEKAPQRLYCLDEID